MPYNKNARGFDPEPPLGFPEIINPGLSSEISRPNRSMHPFDGDEHGHERHDAIPAEEEWPDDEFDPGKEHNPEHPK